jgi:NAD(P)-dependent dehydrogenase (short-subunit alcohol dehydrogenase family)
MRNLEGKVAVVTGAAHGIGRETALALAQKGCRLAICDVNEAALEGVRHEREASGTTVTAHQVDVSDRVQMTAFASDVTSVHPGAIQTNIIRNARLVTDTHQELRDRTQRLFDRLGTTPDVVAERIVKAIEYNSPRVLITKEARMADALKRLMPATTDGIVARVFKRISPQ